MAPLTIIQNPGLRLVLTLSIILNMVLGVVILWKLIAIGNAMAKSQINIVEKIDSTDKHVADVKKDVGDIKNNVHDELAAFTKEGKDRLQTNSENSLISMISSMAAESASELALQEIQNLRKELLAYETRSDAQRQALLDQMKVVREHSAVATQAALAVHAKVSQKILTGPEVQQLKAEAKRKTTVVNIWPWNQPKPSPTPRRGRRR